MRWGGEGVPDVADAHRSPRYLGNVFEHAPDLVQDSNLCYTVTMPVQTGNAYQDGSDYRGWLLGHFVAPATSLRHSQEVEVKFHAIRRGDEWYLFRGPLSGFDALPHDPSYWWPADRAWCVAGDIDFEWAYVAGSQTLIDEVLAVDVLDAICTDPENDARSGMDVINDPDGIVARDG
jgi:hypothetical protein